MVAYAKSLSALDQAKKKEQAVIDLHAAASAKFLSNLADTAATNGLLSVLGQWQAAKEERKQAEQANADSQNMLASAQQNLEEETQKTMGPLTGDVKKEIEQKLSENRTTEFLSLMQEGLPFAAASLSNDVNNAAASRAKQDMTDHFQSLSPQDQTTWIDHIKKYRSGWIS